MPFPATSFFEDLLGGPVEIAEVIGEENARQECGGAGAAAHPQRYLIVDLQVKTGGGDAGVGGDIRVRGENEVSLELGAEVSAPAGGVDAEVFRDGGVDG